MGKRDREQRRHRRYDVKDVRGSLVYLHDATILNISLTGMAVETPSLLKVGVGYTLRLPFQGSVLALPADVRWCHLERTETGASGNVVPVYQAGIDFRSILDDKARQVLEFIEGNVIVELEQRIFGRFKLKSGQDVDLGSSHEMLVRKISLSGALIETELVPPVDAVLALELKPPGSSIELKARVVHSRLSGAAGDERAEIGVEFEGVTPPAREALERLIEALLE